MSNTFQFNGLELAYFRHPYNHADLNMRTVEVPIIGWYIEQAPWANILEIGNVISHYGNIGWAVLDIREQGKGIINADLMRWQPDRLFDLVVSISTLEHVGHGRYAHLTGPTTPAEAWARMCSYVAPAGLAVVTVPLGYNPVLDGQLADGSLHPDEIHCMQRVSDANEWAECSLAEGVEATRPAGYSWATGMAVLICRREGPPLQVLNLGSGRKPIRGAINHDLSLDVQRPFVTVAHDLNLLPWPWADNSFDCIVARAVLEHLNIDLVASLNECWRILRPGGALHLKVPYWRSDRSYSDVTHRWFCNLESFDQFDPERRRGREYEFYTQRHWQIVKGPRLNEAKTSIHVTMRVRK